MALFGKETPPPQRPAGGNARADQPSAAAASVFGPTMVCDGKITGDENLFVEGTVKGQIDLRHDLRIGKSARVEASVHARNVLVEGTLVGDVSADNRIELASGSHVDGNIRAPKIVVAEGARFRGAVAMKGAAATKQTEEKK